MVDVHLRMSEAQAARLDALAQRARVTRSGLVRRLIDAASMDVRVPGERLIESESLDLLHEQARSGRTAAILALLRRGDQRDDVDRLLGELFDGVE
jgi:Ribbon-helix-helix protein, copG family